MKKIIRIILKASLILFFLFTGVFVGTETFGGYNTNALPYIILSVLAAIYFLDNRK